MELSRGAAKFALTDFDKAIELKPDYTRAYCNRGMAKESAGDRLGAIRDYQKALELNLNLSAVRKKLNELEEKQRCN